MMIVRPSRAQIKAAWIVAIGSVSALLLSIAFTWFYAFIPSAFLAANRNSMWVLFGILLFIFGALRVRKLKKDRYRVPSIGVLVMGAVMFSWALREAAFGLLMLINLYPHESEKTICLDVIDNKFNSERARLRKSVLTVTIEGEGSEVRSIEYRRSQVDFSNVSAGDLVALDVVPGLAGYRVIGMSKNSTQCPVEQEIRNN